MNYKLGSLFDGSGGFPLAGSLCGIEPRWASEVEPYPIAVTRERFPQMKHLGDISKINGAEVEPVDIITFGSPCQDLSVAGKRAGLKHEANGDEETTRSGLFMEAVRIIKEMREATGGRYPRFALWENVPGAFSSNKGEDFRVVCEELIKIAEPAAFMPPVPKTGWAYADSYVGDGWSLAYRVFDAQYWGVPQRRRRIHLVVDFRGECAREVLFEREGVRGYFTQSGTPWQGIAENAERGTGADDRTGEETNPLDSRGNPPDSESSLRNRQNGRGRDDWGLSICYGIDGYNADVTGDKAATLTAATGQGSPPAFRSRTDDKSPTLRAEAHGNVPAVVMEPMGINGEVAGTLDASYYKGCGMRQGVEREVVAQPIPIHDQATRFSGKRGDKSDGKGNGLGVGNPGDPMNTLTSGDRHAVGYRMGGFADYVEGEVGTLKASGGDLGGGSENLIVERKVRYIVRRLTTTECARLQGFADAWGQIEQKDNLTDEEYHFWLEVRNTHAAINGKPTKEYTKAQILTWYNKLYTDSAEYKMWGNGIALPPALYVLQGMADVLNGEQPLTQAEIDGALLRVYDVIAEREDEERDEPTDLSDAPEAIKAEIIENAEKLEERETVKEATEDETMEQKNIEEQATAKETTPADFCAVAQLRRLAEERKALANLRPEDPRFSNDVRAIEYAVGVLEAVGL